MCDTKEKIMHSLALSSWWHLKQQAKTTFAALALRNYRLFFIGQGISLSGTWMQTVAQGWLVLQLTGSGTQVGFVVAVQFLPLLFLTPIGGMIADTYPKRRILITTQSLFTVIQFALGFIVVLHIAQLWMIYALALIYGLINAVDNPTRQAFVSELVDRQYIRNAVTLNSVEVNLARAVGPTIGAIVIGTLGIGWCFIGNGLTTLAVIVSLLRMKTRDIHTAAAKGRPHPLRQLVEAWGYAREKKLIRDILIMATIVGTFSYEFQTTLPVFAKFVFSSNASSYSQLWVAFGLGSVVGGLLAAGRTRASVGYLIRSTVLFGLCMLAVSVMPSLTLATLGMLLVGFFSINFTSLANTMLQLEADDSHRGRVMSLWTMAMLGTTPIGGPVVGYLAEVFGARYGLAVGGAAALLAGIFSIAPRFQSEHLLAIPSYLKTSIFRAGNEEDAKLR